MNFKPTFENRQIAIEKNLFVESLTSKLIKHMMGLDLLGSTKSLDNKSSSISLRAKIDLLTDCGKMTSRLTPIYCPLLALEISLHIILNAIILKICLNLLMELISHYLNIAQI